MAFYDNNNDGIVRFEDFETSFGGFLAPDVKVLVTRKSAKTITDPNFSFFTLEGPSTNPLDLSWRSHSNDRHVGHTR
jgi:hypothetical protein